MEKKDKKYTLKVKGKEVEVNEEIQTFTSTTAQI